MVEKLNEKHKNTTNQIFPHYDHVLIMFDGINEEITIVNRRTEHAVITTNIIPCCYRHGL